MTTSRSPGRGIRPALDDVVGDQPGGRDLRAREHERRESVAQGPGEREPPGRHAEIVVGSAAGSRSVAAWRPWSGVHVGRGGHAGMICRYHLPGCAICPVSRSSSARRPSTRCRGSRRPSAAGSRSGSSARTCCRSRSAATSCATWSSSSARRWPRAPTRWSRAVGAGPTTPASPPPPARGPGLSVELVLSGPPSVVPGRASACR